MSFENRNYAFAGAFVDELARCGLKHVVICPGSRSSPLTISFARRPDIKKWVHLDERSAAFFALGMARALGAPVAVVCTSGTAAANFYPAVVEAHHSAVPLLALTADRPPELWDSGALQTIDQVRMYGAHAKWSVVMPPPEATTDLMVFVRATACRAFASALESPAGPVHVDFPFRDPLDPEAVPQDFSAEAKDGGNTSWHGRKDGLPFVQSLTPERRLPPEDTRRLASELSAVERGIIVCGPQPDPHLANAVSDLASRLKYPILADALSQVRCGPHDRSLVVDCYDAFLRDADVASSLAPEVVLRFGALPVSKPLAQYLEKHRAARHILVDGNTAWKDPLRVASEMVRTDPALLCGGIAALLDRKPAPATWAQRWLTVAEATRPAIRREMDGFGQMFEGKTFEELARVLPTEAVLFASNSMPVRDMDTFFPTSDKRIRFMANRGASGIDGVTSTALGVAASSNKKLVLVLGDISFYHDMNGLLAARTYGLNATIIVVNNDGGGIFSFLPQAKYDDVFEPYFGTPHGLTFRAAAEQYGLGYQRIEDWGRFREAVAESLAKGGANIIEIPSERALNVRLHRQVWAAVSSAVHARVGT